MSDPWGNNFPSQFDIGTPGGGHMHFGQDGTQTLYGPDGVTILAQLSPATGLTVNQGVIQTASAGKRVEMASSSGDTLHFFTGDAAEQLEGLIIVGVNGIPSNPARQGTLQMLPPRLGTNNGPSITWAGESADGTIKGGFTIAHTRLGTYPITWDGNTLQTTGGYFKAFNLPGIDDGTIVNVTVNAGATSGTATFTWPKAAFTSAPIVSLAMVSGSGSTPRNIFLSLTANGAAGGTVRVDTTSAPASSTTFPIHVRGYQA